MIEINARNQATKLRKTLICLSIQVPLRLRIMQCFNTEWCFCEGVCHNENPVAVTRAVSEKRIWSFMTVEIPTKFT